MKKILCALAAFMLMPLLASATPLAKEIAFSRSCSSGVPVYDNAQGTISCGKPKMGGTGYVIEMATNPDGSATCPNGFSYVGVVKGMGDGAGIQRYACAKN